jgi:hypothetical protein
VLFILFRDFDTLILADKDEPGIRFMGKELDLCHLPATISESIVDQVMENPLNQRIGKYICSRREWAFLDSEGNRR